MAESSARNARSSRFWPSGKTGPDAKHGARAAGREFEREKENSDVDELELPEDTQFMTDDPVWEARKRLPAGRQRVLEPVACYPHKPPPARPQFRSPPPAYTVPQRTIVPTGIVAHADMVDFDGLDAPSGPKMKPTGKRDLKAQD